MDKKSRTMSSTLRWTSGLVIAAGVLVVPFVVYRWEYTHGKRLRVIVPGQLYRSGQMTGPGFAEAVDRLKLRTVVNLQDDYPDPMIEQGYFWGGTIKESELCRQLGVTYIYIPPDLVLRRLAGIVRPKAIDTLLAIFDDPAKYPILLHCKAGLHRTGVMTAVYRMEYEGWNPSEAIREMKNNGFGEWPCTSANDYITQYILDYRPGVRNGQARIREKGYGQRVHGTRESQPINVKTN
jgi:tyrosine-protein phosphatase SIW14